MLRFAVMEEISKCDSNPVLISYPAAQLPSAEAPEDDLPSHSDAVMHVPFRVGSVDGVHVSC